MADAKVRRLRRHGQSRTPEYRIWLGIIQRCRNPKDKNYHQYESRGICDAWAESFEAFIAHIGPRPSSQHSVDRIENHKGYEPGNVRWATRIEQQRNRGGNVLLTFRGKTQCIAAWAAEIGGARCLIYRRLRRGWSVEEALTVPTKWQKWARRKHAACGAAELQ